MENQKTLAIVVTYNGIKWVDKCIESLINSTFPVDVLVVDNGSTDGTREYIESNFTAVRLIKSETNMFFGRANNIGLKIILEEGYDYAFLLNQDAWIDKDTIGVLVEEFEHRTKYGIISPFHFNWDKTKVDHFMLRMINPDDCPQLISDLVLNKLKNIYKVNFIHAACWLVSKSCVENVGGFDPLFIHYGEDNDYVSRAKLKGYQVGISPKVNVYHYGTFDVSKSNTNKLKFLKINATLDLKTLQNSIMSNYVFFIKKRWDELLNSLLMRNGKNALVELKIIIFSIAIFKKIVVSRRASKTDKAFL